MFNRLIFFIAFVFLFSQSSVVFAQVSSNPTNDCSNVGVETGQFLGWQGYRGEWKAQGDSIGILSTEEGLDSNRHQIRHFGVGRLLEVAAEDIPYVPKGSNYAIQLGNSRNGNQYERLTTSFQVDSTNALFQYRFAVIFEDPDHTPAEQPKFELEVMDQTGATIPCGFYQVTSGGNIPGFKSDGSIRYRNWTTAAVDLRSYIGQTITIRISTYDCSRGGHWGMALFDANCLAAQVNPVNYCPDVDTSITLEAPLGFRDYKWSTGDTTRIITLNRPVKGQEVFVEFTPFSSLSDGCRLSISYVVPSKIEIILPDSLAICEGKTALLTPSLSEENAYEYTWQPGNIKEKSLTTSTPGTYIVEATRGKCTLRDTAVVAQTPPPALTFAETFVSCPGKSDGALTVSAGSYPEPLLYRWNTGANTASIRDLSAGTYSVTATGAYSGCVGTGDKIVPVKEGLKSAANLLKAPFCDDESAGSAIVTVTDGTPPYQYQWSHGDVSSKATITKEGSYMVTVTDAAGCSTTDSISVSILIATLKAEGNYCPQGQKGAIEIDVTGGVAPYEYQLSTQGVFTTDNIFRGLRNAPYAILVKDAAGCLRTYETEIKLLRDPAFTVNLPADTAIQLGQTIQIAPRSNYPIAFYEWKSVELATPGQDSVLTLRPFKTTIVSLEAEDNYGCRSEATMQIQVEKRRGIYIPNVFKPIGESGNNRFYISVLEQQFKAVLSMLIYDRWGNQVHQDFRHIPNDPGGGWDGIFDGRPAPPGVYTYRIEVEYVDGSRELFKGDVTIVR
jgi:gliding motility-associated-like protein